MSEYWVSTGKYWCKYCKIYVTNNKPSISAHEASVRHKSAVGRFIKDVRASAAEQAKAADLLRQVEKEAEKQFAQDIKSGLSSGEALSSKPTESKKTSTTKKDNRRIAAEATRAALDESRGILEHAAATPGEWQEVQAAGPKASTSAAEYLQEEENDEDYSSFKFKEKSARLDDDEGAEDAAPVAFKKRKTNRSMRIKED